MAEVTYKKITELDSASLPLDGANEYTLLSQSGVSKKALWSGIFGSGWWAKLKAAFDDFVAPEALHATDADSLGGESASFYTNASNLTSGALPLERIPAELTGKNAATATLAATATNALACSGNAATATSATAAGSATKFNGLNVKYIDLGAWNMDSLSTLWVNHGVADFKKIRNISVTIYRDNLTNSYLITGGLGQSSSVYNNTAYIGAIGSTEFPIVRLDGGVFDNSDFSSTGISRGVASIFYQD